MEKESRLKDFLENPYKSMWKMALPIIAGMMVQTLFNVVDIMFIGWLGADEVTAVAFVSPLFFIIIGIIYIFRYIFSVKISCFIIILLLYENLRHCSFSWKK